MVIFNLFWALIPLAFGHNGPHYSRQAIEIIIPNRMKI
jgi:hypothetical protein